MIDLNTERMRGKGQYLIDGFQVNNLYGLKDLCEKFLTKNSLILELGTNNGISTKLFSFYCDKIISVDWVKSTEIDDLLLENKNIEFEHMSFEDFFKKNTYKFDCIYIDGSHEYEDVKKDILLSKNFIKETGFISGYDYNSTCPGVIRAVNELFLSVEIFKDSSWIGLK